MTLTNEEVIKLYIGLKQVSNLPGAKFAYAVAKNLKRIEKIVFKLKRLDTPSEKFMEMEAARVELAKSHAVKENGKPKLRIEEDGVKRYDILDQKLFDKEFEDLREKHRDVITDREKKIVEFDKLLKEEVAIDFHMVSQDNIPANINTNLLVEIMPIIKE